MYGLFDTHFCEHLGGRDGLYLIESFNQILTTLTWKADKIPTELIEKFRRVFGGVAIGRNKAGDLVPFCPAFGGDIGIDGIGMDVSGVTLNGENITGRRGEDIAIIWNNSLYYPDLPFLKWYAEMFDQVDKSMRVNLIMARLFPIGVANTEQMMKSMEDAYEKVISGEELFAIVKGVDLKDDGEVFKTTEITQVGNIDKIQYLSKFHDDLTRRLYVRYGIPMTNSNGKMAQTNESELAGYEFYSQIYLNDNLEFAKRGCEEVNRIFGTNWTVELSKPFQRANEDALKENEEKEVVEDNVNEENVNEEENNNE